MSFSQLAKDFAGSTNPLYALREKFVVDGVEVVDLVRGNVTEHGITFPPEILRDILIRAAEAAQVYRPDPRGQRIAREAIASEYASLPIAPEQVLLTPGTSVSYWYCFKLLAEPGDEILYPQPSYPLLDYVAKLCGVELKHYKLIESCKWALDLDFLEQQISKKTRAIVLVSPHNPTGMVCSKDEINSLAEIAIRHNLPIISDEVFSDFLFGTNELVRPSELAAPLVFTLNGISKKFALPGMKLGWIIASGEKSQIQTALDVLETISDTFLPVSEVTQFAVPSIIERGQGFLQHYVQWVTGCRDTAVKALSGLEFAPPQGGYYLTLPISRDEEEVTMQLLKDEHILVHPGHFYGIDGNHLVMTFIYEPEELKASLERLSRYA